MISSGYLRAFIENLIMPQVLKITRKKRAAKKHAWILHSERSGILSAGFAAPQKKCECKDFSTPCKFMHSIPD